MKPIGLFGGTFDPPHHGHLRPLLELAEELPFTEIRVLPCRLPPHRPPPQASPEQRRDMLRLALAGMPRLVLDQRELHREGPSYTVDTLQSLRGEAPSTPLCWILGRDAFAGIDRWHRWERVLELAHLVVCHRPGQGSLRGTARRLLAERGVDSPWQLNAAAAGSILPWPVTQLDIAATRLRALASAGRDLRFLVPDPVRDYIEQHRIYRTAAAQARVR